MKKLFAIFAVIGMTICAGNQASAQGFLNKLKKGAEKATSAVKSVTDATGVTQNEATDTATVQVDWSNIPVYTAQQVNVVDSVGNPVLNEDGTPQIRVFLVDQNGNKRSAEAVKAQNKALLKAAGMVLAKVGGGALIGGLAKGGTGAAIGAATGALASIGDINTIRKQKKSLDQQKKLLKAYSQNFTDEGVPVDAAADLSKVKDLNLTNEATSTLSEAEIAALTADPKFNDSSVAGLDDIEI